MKKKKLSLSSKERGLAASAWTRQYFKHHQIMVSKN